MSGPARASADRGPRSARQGGVYSLHTRGRRALCLGAVCLAGLLMAACMHTVLSEPAGFSGTPRSPAPASPSPPQLTGDPDRPYLLQTQPPYTVALDAGHGGFDTGAEAIIKELEVCEQTVNALYTLLEQDSNYAPVRTRPNGEDRSIKERAQAATDAGASLLLSVHANSDESTGQSHGFECFPTPPGRTYSEESMRFAQCIAQKMGGAGHRLRGENGIRFAYYNGKSKRIVDSTDTKIREQKSFGIVERPYCPAVLVEQCFLTNYSDVENWTGEAGCARAARIYYEAICAYFGTEPLPQGGSVCIGMLPIFLYCARWGCKESFLASFAYGLLQLIFDGAYAWGPTSMLLDYVLAFGVLGVACLFRKQRGGVFVGTVVGCLCRFLVHFISGITIYRIYEPTELFNTTFANPYIYSAAYNGSYMAIDLVLCLVITALLYRPLSRYFAPQEAAAAARKNQGPEL